MNDFSNLIIWGKYELPHKSGIYLFENIINKKIYIGQAQDLHERILTHFTGDYNNYFHKALHKYGEKGFNIYVLEFCDVEDLDNKEIYYISKFKSNVSGIGYNLTSGGQGHLGVPCSEQTKEKLSELHKKETWGYNFETGEIFSASSRENIVNQLNDLGYKEISWTKVVDAIRNKSYTSCFIFGNSKEEVISNSKNIKLPKKYTLYLYNYKTGEMSPLICSLPEGEEYIRQQGYKVASGHLATAIRNNNRYIKDFIFGESLKEINDKLNRYGIVTYCYNLNDNTLLRFTESNENICLKLEQLYPGIHLCRASVGKVKNNKQIQTIGFIFDTNLSSLINRVSKHNSDCSEKIFSLAKEYNYLDSQEIIEWQDKLNSISVDYSGN